MFRNFHFYKQILKNFSNAPDNVDFIEIFLFPKKLTFLKYEVLLLDVHQ